MGRVGHKNMTDHPKLLKKRKRESILPLTAIHRADGAEGSRERERESTGLARPLKTSALTVQSHLFI